MRIIFIHGINNQGSSREHIEATWSAALKNSIQTAGGSLPADTIFSAAFYGDVLDNETENWAQEKDATTAMSASSPNEDYVDPEVAALYREFQERYGLSDDDVAAKLGAEDQPTALKPMARGIHKRWLKAIARALEDILPTRGKYIARIFLRQAAAYLQKPGLKERIDDMVFEQVFKNVPADENIFVISHSLGTIVAYALLRRFRQNIHAKLLLTLGSPLGIEIVRNRLGPPLICLPNVDTWCNVADKEDFVALHSQLNAHTFGCDHVKNTDDVDNGEDDAHSIKKYLSQPVVAKAVLDALRAA